MLNIFYKRYPFGTKEAFAEDELAELAKRYDKIRIYCFPDKTGIKRDLPDNCELIPLYDKKREKSRKVLAFFKLFTLKTLREIFFMRKCGYKFNGKNLHRIYNYYFYDGFADQKKIDASPGDIFYSYWLGDVSYPVSKIKMREPGIIFISRAHGFDMYADRGYNPFRREIIGNLDHLYCINSSGKDDILAHYPELISSDRVTVAHLGVRCPEKKVDRVFGGDETVIVTVSNVIPLKRLDMLTGALSKLEEKIVWYHFGSGPLESEIKALAKEKLSAKENINYEFKGQTPHDEVMRFLRETKVDLFVNCSDHEGIPVSIMEAMAFGIPCIARDVGGVCELVDEKCGFMLGKTTDEDKLSEAIGKYIALPAEEKKRMSENAFDKIKREFDSVGNYEKFCDSIDGIRRYKEEQNGKREG